MTTDPVCKTDIEEKEAEFSSQYAGQRYYFCSEECKESFENQPEQYVSSAA